ncbi:hypothetical protein KBX26_20885 [Micromonospora sp. C97]|uniref:hypothetical protein n=1 Tax=Micromonospora sp. C97 TaxID=2824883 RepID=UPI001B37A8F8|nr:hypothetical protein [Micromonospora sp. C97]MBQ1032454.1 hypothetical protein [Micromonospora sp. C97]
MVMRTPDGVDAARARRRGGLLVVAFGLLAYAGTTAVDAPTRALGLSWSIIGAAGALGVLTIMVAARRRAVRLADAARLMMAVAALAALAVGVALAPRGAERGFVIAVTGVLAAALAASALLAGDLRPKGRGAA